MTDRETLISLLEKMGLRPYQGDLHGLPDDGYLECADREGGGYSVFIGAGAGYSGFYAEFRFDEAGGIVGHGIWE